MLHGVVGELVYEFEATVEAREVVEVGVSLSVRKEDMDDECGRDVLWGCSTAGDEGEDIFV
jgi:hypothetical protein